MKKPMLFLLGCVRALLGNDYVSRSYRREFVRLGRSVLRRKKLF
jgi:hypothetical protein